MSVRKLDRAEAAELTPPGKTTDDPGTMPDYLPLQLRRALFADWVNHRQAQMIGWLVEENRELKEQLNGKRLRVTDHAVRASVSGLQPACPLPVPHP